MTIYPQLDQLESAGLVRLVHVQPELEYLFRHNLVQDAAYSSLLRQDRKRLHMLIGTLCSWAVFTAMLISRRTEGSEAV